MKIIRKIKNFFGKTESVDVRLTKEELETLKETMDKMSWLLQQYQSCLEVAEAVDDEQTKKMYQWKITDMERRLREMERRASAC